MKSIAAVREMRVMLYPQDFAETRRFYREVLDWPIACEWDRSESRGVMFDTGSGILELLTPPDPAIRARRCRLSLRVDDVWTLWLDLQGRATVVFPLRQNAWGDDSFCISDPDSNELVFFTNRPPAY